MVPLTDQSVSFVGDIPGEYQRGLVPVMFADYARETARRVAASGARRVLELAAGTGIVTRALLAELPRDAALMATDLNAPMLDAARALIPQDARLSFRTADATELPFEDGMFDAVVCQFGVMFYPDKDKGHSEARRVLAPDGRYTFAVWDSPERNPASQMVGELVRDVFPGDPPTFMNIPFGYHDLEAIRASLADAGFGRVDISILPEMRVVNDLGGYARGLVFGNPLGDQVRARGGEPERIVERLHASLAKTFGDSPARIPVQAIILEARFGGLSPRQGGYRPLPTPSPG